MMFFARWKTAAIGAVLLLGVLLCLPNLFPASSLPDWARRISLGLDLRGGSYLLMEVDLNAVVRERLDGLVDGARTRLRGANIQYVNLQADPAGLRVRLTVETSGLAVSSRWARLKMTPAAHDYLSPLPPGSPLTVHPEPQRESRGHFAVMNATVLAADWTELHADGHRRALIDEQGARWVAP